MQTSLTTEISVPGQQLCGLTWMQGQLWFSDGILDRVFAVDPVEGVITRTLSCPDVLTGLTSYGDQLLQVAGPERGLRVIDPMTGAVLREIGNPRPGLELCGIETCSAGIWLGYEDPPMLDLRSETDFSLVNSIPVEEGVAGVTYADGLVAYASYQDAHIYLVDPATGKRVGTLDVQGHPTGLTWDGKRFWYCDHSGVKLRSIAMPTH